LLSDKKTKFLSPFKPHGAVSYRTLNVSAEFYTKVLNLENNSTPEVENENGCQVGDGKELHLFINF